MTAKDTLTRFLIEDLDIRGELLLLEKTTDDVLSRHDYPPSLSQKLGEAVCCALLLSATLKMQGNTAIQARGNGPLTLLMAEASSQRTVRGLARWKEEPALGNPSLKAMLGEGAALVITLTPDKGQRYQGIVPLEHDALARCLEDYFRDSEQLRTSVQLFHVGSRWGGLLLQELPSKREPAEKELNWEHIQALSRTLTAEEATELEATTLLHRLFHEHTTRVMGSQNARFACTCSEERTLTALHSLGEDTLKDILKEQGAVDMNCEFCGQHYHFDRDRISRLFGGPRIH